MRTVVLSGIGKGSTGVGHLMETLERSLLEKNVSHVSIVSKNGGDGIRQLIKEKKFFKLFGVISNKIYIKVRAFIWMWIIASRKSVSVVVVHPQTLGFKYVIKLLRQRRSNFYIYVVDNSFFCIRSYNSVYPEYRACLKCVGGDLSYISKYGCEPFPVKDNEAIEFVKVLRESVSQGGVEFLCLTQTQKRLLEMNFTSRVKAKVIGIWYKEFGLLEGDLNHAELLSCDFDVVFHGVALHAKGFYWAYELAGNCPELNFLFPFSCEGLLIDKKSNCKFIPMSWSNGLRSAAENSRINLVPSCWSAPIEGAMIQSIAVARAVAVIDEDTSFTQELPDGLVVKLPYDVERASVIIRKIINDDWKPSLDLKKKWSRKFIESNVNIIEEIPGFN